MHLPEVCRKFGLLIMAAGYIAVGGNYFPPGFQVARNLACNSCTGFLSLLVTHLLVETDTQKLHRHFLQDCRLFRRNSSKQPGGRIKSPVSIIAGEWLLMSPLVAHFS